MSCLEFSDASAYGFFRHIDRELIRLSRIDICRSCTAAPQRPRHEHRVVWFVCFPSLLCSFLILSASIFYLASSLSFTPLPSGLPEVYTNKKEMWSNISKRGEGEAQEYPQLIPICTLAPTVPRTLVRGVGWNGYANQVKPVNVDSVGPE